MQLLNTLYVTTPDAYLRLDNDTISVKVEDEVKLRVPIHHLSSVVIFGNIGISTPLMHRLAGDGITLVMLDTNGRFKARLEGGVSGNVLLRQAQHQRALDAYAASLFSNEERGLKPTCTTKSRHAANGIEKIGAGVLAIY